MADEVIYLIFDHTFKNSIFVLEILALSIPFMFIAAHMQNALFAVNKEKVVTRTLGFITILNIVLNLTLIPVFGHIGAAWSVVLTQVVTFAILLSYLALVERIKTFNYCDFNLYRFVFSI